MRSFLIYLLILPGFLLPLCDGPGPDTYIDLDTGKTVIILGDVEDGDIPFVLDTGNSDNDFGYDGDYDK